VGGWSLNEDNLLVALVTRRTFVGDNRHHMWSEIARLIRGKTDHQCWQRWSTELDPSLNSGPFDEKEDAIILNMYGECLFLLDDLCCIELVCMMM